MQQQSELPEGWAEAKISAICQLINGRAFKPSEWADKGLPIVRIQNLNNVDATFNFCDFEVDSRYHMNSGQLLFSWSGTPGTSFGAHIWERGDAVLNQHIFRVEIDENKINKLFLKHSLNYNIAGYIEKAHGTAGLAHITKKKFETSILSFPPLAEQHRIVSAIEALFARLDAANERLDRVPDILKKFRRSVLAAACDGRLTEDWREENPHVEDGSSLLNQIKKKHDSEGKGHGGKAALPTNGIHKMDIESFPKSWGIDELKWICKPGRSITYGILKPGPHQLNGVPYIRVADFPNDEIILSKIKRTTSEIANNYKRSVLDYGDILLSIRGTVGRVCRVPQELQGSNVTQDTARISVCEEINADFVEIYLRSPNLQKRLEKAIKGVAIRGVNIGDVRPLQIIIPPLPEQHEIVRRVDALFVLANSIEAKVAAARERTEKLRQSILAKAFSGELVETEAELARREGRDYEPADVLLERIKTERGKSGKKGKAAK